MRRVENTTPGLSLDFYLRGVWPGFFHVGRRSRKSGGNWEGGEEVPCPQPESRDCIGNINFDALAIF